jgi:hypothetical protein
MEREKQYVLGMMQDRGSKKATKWGHKTDGVKGFDEGFSEAATRCFSRQPEKEEIS